ncbi:hypothetical protein [Streptomyces sp. CoH27]|nr:hypothetical protein [Streptomyces sp. CoH27]
MAQPRLAGPRQHLVQPVGTDVGLPRRYRELAKVALTAMATCVGR